MKKIVFIIGSLRKGSFNGRLAKCAEEALAGRAEIAYLDPRSVPLMDMDIEYPAPPEVQAARETVLAADGLWIFSPEYNHNVPGALKNLIDWLSRPLLPPPAEKKTCLMGKKVAFTGAGGKSETADLRRHLHVMFEKHLKAEVIGGDGVGFAMPHEAFSEKVWDTPPEVFDAVRRQAEEFYAAL